MTTTAEIAKDFTALLKAGEHDAAADRYNADDIASHEAMDGPMAVCRGKAAVKAKGEWWVANHEVHAMEIEGPFVNGDQFAIRLFIDVTVKESGTRQAMTEVGLYTVKNGKVVEERFFY